MLNESRKARAALIVAIVGAVFCAWSMTHLSARGPCCYHPDCNPVCKCKGCQCAVK